MHCSRRIQQPSDWAYAGKGSSSNHHNKQHPAKKLALSPVPGRPPVPSWGSSESMRQQPPTPTRGTMASSSSMRRPSAASTMPINLSLSEDERSPPNRSNSEVLSSPQFGKSRPATRADSGGSPLEDEDMLYEYFPLSVDDWLVFLAPFRLLHDSHAIPAPRSYPYYY